METSTEVELNQLLEELSEIKAEDDDNYGDDDSPPPPPPRDSLVFDSPMDEAARTSHRVSVQGGKISYYEEPKGRSSDRFGDTGTERFSTRPGNNNNNVSAPQNTSSSNNAPRSSDRFGTGGNERFSERNNTSQQQPVQSEDRFSDRGNEEDNRFSNSNNVQEDRFSDRGNEQEGFSEQDSFSSPSSTLCGVCNKDIDGDALQAFNTLYHFKCFSCSGCKKNIGTEEFFDKDNKAYCLTCYKSSFLPSCCRCRKAIEGRYLKALNQDFHENCFSCAVCSQPFSDGKFYEKDENPYCLQHYNELFGYTCAKCHQTITDGTAIAALDKYWHRHHFTCTKCNKAFSDGKFFEDEGQPYCQEHYHERRGTICGKCSRPIDGMCVSALDKKWHQDCFTCTKCSNVLSGQVMLSEGNVYCPNCASTL